MGSDSSYQASVHSCTQAETGDRKSHTLSLWAQTTSARFSSFRSRDPVAGRMGVEPTPHWLNEQTPLDEDWGLRYFQCRSLPAPWYSHHPQKVTKYWSVLAEQLRSISLWRDTSSRLFIHSSIRHQIPGIGCFLLHPATTIEAVIQQQPCTFCIVMWRRQYVFIYFVG